MNSSPDPSNTLEHVLDIISEGVWDWDVPSGHVSRSSGWYRMLGYDKDSLNKDVLTWENVIHPDDYPQVMAHFEEYVSGKIPHYCIQYRCIKADKSALWIEDSGKIVERLENGSPSRMIGAHTNIHEFKTAQEKLSQQAQLIVGDYANLEHIIQVRTHELAELNSKLEDKVEEVEYIASRDALTGVYNRRMFEQLIEIEIKRAKRYSQPMSVILADIDLFKNINDQHGHSTGDKVLYSVANTLLGHIRDSDLLARWGGEEFAIILPNTEADTALEMAERLRHSIAEMRSYNNIQVTCSFGVTEFSPDDNGDSIFSRMDQALYQAKDCNRNNVKLMPVV
jgi:diguanylate cyclase (GGDEF)-like protein/PAS domain S-box-containing protein